MTRAELKSRFLDDCGWGDARRAPLAGDASDRSYERLWQAGGSAVLMDAPPGQGDDPAAFTAMARHLLDAGLSAPRILGEDLAHGFLLLEDLGDGIFARLIEADPDIETHLYSEAVAVLARLHQLAAPANLPNLAAHDWAEAAAFALNWYAFAITGTRPPAEDFIATMTEAMTRHADGPRVLILRDYHAENLLWLPKREGLARVGLLDFQLGQMGQPGYDLVSLLQDARRDVGADTETAMIRHFLDLTGGSQLSFSATYATLGAQRALRILGVFARLCLVSGKSGYLRLLPRVWGQLQTNLSHPDLAQLKSLCETLLPAPIPTNIAIIETKCKTCQTP